MRTALALTAVLLLISPAAAQQEWGDIKGRVVWPDDVPIPAPRNLAVPAGVPPLVDNSLIVDSRTRGVRNVMVWLAPVEKGGNLPIHPARAAAPAKPVVIDQPRMMFEPRITMLRAGQQLVIKNSAAVAHNTHITGSADINGSLNLNLPPLGQIVKMLKAEPRPLVLQCDIHGWMGGRIGVFDHPYFALTADDGAFEISSAPAGKYLIYIQHETGGWQHKPRVATNGVGGKLGQPIVIPARGTLELGKIPFTR